VLRFGGKTKGTCRAAFRDERDPNRIRCSAPEHELVSAPGAATGLASREVAVRLGSAVLVIWLVIGAIAGAQRHYYSGSAASCTKASTIAVTILAGPLNYVGVNPKVDCHVPQPSQ
jgi:hypothetical protein